MLPTTMDFGFIARTLKTTGILALIFFAFGAAYLDIFKALSLLFGIIWGIINLYFLTLLVRAVLRPEGPDKKFALGLVLIKFPLLYAAGYFLISNPEFHISWLVIGFSVIFAVMILKVLGRAVLGLDNARPNGNHSPKEAV